MAVGKQNSELRLRKVNGDVWELIIPEALFNLKFSMTARHESELEDERGPTIH